MTTIKKILFVTHKPKQCGVYEFGKNVYNAISKSRKFQFRKAECESIEELQLEITSFQPEAIIYNYHPSVMPWLCVKISKGIYRNNVVNIRIPQIGIIHEITQEVADSATGYRNKFVTGGSHKRLNSFFDFYIAADPTLLLKNPIVFKTGRLIPEYQNLKPLPNLPIIGSFGFGTPNKGFEKLVAKVQQEFSEAIIRLNIPSADFGDPDGVSARKIAENCKSLIKNKSVQIEISHQFLSNKELLDFLAGNSLNAFMYEDTGGRGLSSTVDNAIAVQRPLAVSDSLMFRHILDNCPGANAQKFSLKEIIQRGTDCIEHLAKDWNADNLLWEYERILKTIFAARENLILKKQGIAKTIRSIWRKLFSLPDEQFTWLTNTKAASDDDLTASISNKYDPVILGSEGFNKILDDNARNLYAQSVETLKRLVPLTMAKKIERANVQQAFVFDTVYRFCATYTNPKLLCVGSYEDTASMSLKKMGYEVEEIDPMINYFLQDYFEKPSTNKNYYDIIFSTSVIEHDPDDKSFIECIERLLAPGGIAVITCDYKDGWKSGDPKPEVDARFYTKKDLEKRLPSYLNESKVIDNPSWDCPNPDFNYLGKYQYTFATFVFRKNK